MKTLIPPLFLALAYFVAGWLGYQQRLASGMPPMFWIPHGIIIGGFLVYGLRIWPAFALASLALNFARGYPGYTAPLLTLGHLGGPWLGCYILQRRGQKPLRFGTLPEVSCF